MIIVVERNSINLVEFVQPQIVECTQPVFPSFLRVIEPSQRSDTVVRVYRNNGELSLSTRFREIIRLRERHRGKTMQLKLQRLNPRINL